MKDGKNQAMASKSHNPADLVSVVKPRGEAEWFKSVPQVYNQINHDKAMLVLCTQTPSTLPWYSRGSRSDKNIVAKLAIRSFVL